MQTKTQDSDMQPGGGGESAGVFAIESLTFIPPFLTAELLNTEGRDKRGTGEKQRLSVVRGRDGHTESH